MKIWRQECKTGTKVGTKSRLVSDFPNNIDDTKGANNDIGKRTNA